jgi:sensor domain CHASE-containing protein
VSPRNAYFSGGNHVRQSNPPKDKVSKNSSLRSGAVRAVVAWVSVALLSVGVWQTAAAGIIGTRSVLDAELRDVRIEQVERLLSQAQVRDQLVALGVDPAWAVTRVASLTDEELRLLEQDLQNLPAGGLLEVIGIVFVVLLVLELVGVTDIFKKM